MNKNILNLRLLILVLSLFSFTQLIPSSNYIMPVSGSPYSSSGVYPYFSYYSPDNKWLAAANYDSNDIAVFAVNPNTGVLTEISGSPFALPGLDGPYPMAYSPVIAGNYYLAVANYSNATVSVFPVNADGTFATQVTGSPFACGLDPYGVAYSSNAKWFAVANASSNTVSVYSVTQSGASAGALTPVAGSPFNLGGILSDPGAVAYSPDNKYLAISCYSNSRIVVCSVNQSTGVITPIQTINDITNTYFVNYSPDGKWAAATSTASKVFVFSVNSDGTFTAVNGSPFATSADAYGLSYSPNSSYLAVGCDDNTVNIFSVNADGSLTFVRLPVNIAGGDYPWNVVYSPNGQWLTVSTPYSYTISEFTTLSTDPFVRALEIKYWPLLNS